jgi:hypothetical protein
MLKEVPMAATVVFPIFTVNGRAGSFATRKKASPRSSVTSRASRLNVAQSTERAPALTTDPSSSDTSRFSPARVSTIVTVGSNCAERMS